MIALVRDGGLLNVCRQSSGIDGGVVHQVSE